MKLRDATLSLFVLVAASLAAVGCSGSDGEISVESAPGAPTDAPNETLFTVKVESAREGGYDASTLEVKATPDGKSAVTVTCTPVETSVNGKLEKGEKLTCTEGATNVFGKDVVGKEIDVELFAKIDGASERVGSATWKP